MKSFDIDDRVRDDLDFELAFPEQGDLSQDQEWCTVQTDGEQRRIRFHDYGEIYAIEGLYEHLFYETLECRSPTVVCDLLEETVESGEDPGSLSQLSVLDVGAGNGMVGEELQNRGVEQVVGIDLIPEAAAAAERDRPGTYTDYFVEDLTDLSERGRVRLETMEFNCLTSVAALGFGDIPPEAFVAALRLVEHDSWLAFNIRDKFLETDESSGFSRLIERMIDEGVLDRVRKRKYRHRLSMNGKPLHYYAISARVVDGVPAEWVEEAESVA